MSEYMNTFTISVLTVLLFWGGWALPVMPFDGLAHNPLSLLWLLLKTAVVIWVIFWIRGTYPRLRIDQLMAFGWKVLVPLSFINIVLTGVVMFYRLPMWSLGVVSTLFLGLTFYVIRNNPGAKISRDTVNVVPAKDLRPPLGDPQFPLSRDKVREVSSERSGHQ